MLANLKNYLQNKSKLWKSLMIISIVLFLVILSCLLWAFAARPGIKSKADISAVADDNSALSVKKSAKCDNCARRQIDGVYVEPSIADLAPVAIMIDNHPDARPPAGLEKANLVYEAEVEGYYTRLMAVFASGGEVGKIGPVRSARPYFVDWANELQAVYAHCGGSPEALVDIEQKGIVDLNEFYNGQYFWRAADRSAPHNIYISSADFNKFLTAKNITAGDYQAWQYKEDSPVADSSTTEPILIDYRAPEFQAKWVYDKTGNDYIRYYQDKLVLTADNNLLVAKNVIIQTVPAAVIDAVLRLKMQDVGSGIAKICLDGACRPGAWSKPDSSSRTIFSYADGEEVKFNAGTTWVEVMRPN
ncbi:MAG: DUF3048 domain-containing protein [Patescibacteria group bacterium]|nr:DUF3048 domain-containing protein [Patescibacteria group bacterium]